MGCLKCSNFFCYLLKNSEMGCLKCSNFRLLLLYTGEQ